MGKSKVTDEQLTAALLDKQYKTYYAVAKSLGLVPQSSFNTRCHYIEAAYGIEPRETPTERTGRPKGSKDSHKRQIANCRPPERIIKSPVTVEPFIGVPMPKPKPDKPKFPFAVNEQVYYDNRLCTVVMATAEKIILRKNADLRHTTLTMEEYIKNPNIVRQIEEKPPCTTTGEAMVLRKRAKEYIQDTETAETAKNFEPFEDIDYTDEEWGVKPTFGEKIKNFARKLIGR